MATDEQGRDAGRRRADGRRAEMLAARYLAASGLDVLEVNVHVGGGEIDIVARDGDELVFVEVRSRRARSPFTPEASLGPRKRACLMRAAAAWLAARDRESVPFRFDLVAVLRGEEQIRIRHHARLVFPDE